MRNRAILLVGAIFLGGCSSEPPANLGIQNGKLQPCPDSPNCVSTQSSDERHRIEPLEFRGSGEETMAALIKILEEMARTKIVTKKANYLHVEFRTRIGFVDDVEFYLDDDSRMVHFRSVSRVGYSDLGVNRKRMERFRVLYSQQP